MRETNKLDSAKVARRRAYDYLDRASSKEVNDIQDFIKPLSHSGFTEYRVRIRYEETITKLEQQGYRVEKLVDAKRVWGIFHRNPVYSIRWDYEDRE